MSYGDLSPTPCLLEEVTTRCWGDKQSSRFKGNILIFKKIVAAGANMGSEWESERYWMLRES